jgi:hypothetical protein
VTIEADACIHRFLIHLLPEGSDDVVCLSVMALQPPRSVPPDGPPRHISAVSAGLAIRVSAAATSLAVRQTVAFWTKRSSLIWPSMVIRC